MFELPENPMGAGVGAGAWAEDRADRVDMTVKGEPRIQPMRLHPQFHVDHLSADPRGMTVIGAGGEPAGTITDLWIDRGEPQVRYYEVALGEGDHVLLPVGYCRVKKSAGEVRVQAIYAHQFAGVPRPAAEDRITLLEEDRIFGYYTGGYRFADEHRNKPLV